MKQELAEVRGFCLNQDGAAYGKAQSSQRLSSPLLSASCWESINKAHGGCAGGSKYLGENFVVT